MAQLHMNGSRATALLFVLVILGCEREPVGQGLQIGIIDFYGLNRVSATLVRQALTFKEGDTISLADGEHPAFLAESENRLSMLPGVIRARMNITCCDQGRVLVYVGIEERGAVVTRYRGAQRVWRTTSSKQMTSSRRLSWWRPRVVRQQRTIPRGTHLLTTP